MQVLVFLLGLQLAKLVQTSGGLQLEGVKCNGLFGLHETMDKTNPKSFFLTRMITLLLIEYVVKVCVVCLICNFKCLLLPCRVKVTSKTHSNFSYTLQ